MASLPDPYLSPQEYLAVERKASFKSEYLDGGCYAMAGASPRHNRITANLIIRLGVELGHGPCQVFPSDLKVRASATRYFYPDVSVICGPLQYADEDQDVVLNPTVIIEVLSETTSLYDRGKKFFAYQGIPSLKEYLLGAQDEFVVEQYTRQEKDAWLYLKTEGLQGSVRLPSIGATLSLSEVYARVDGL